MHAPSSSRSLYQFSLPAIDGQELILADFQGKVVLAVNVASRCGLTPQYKELQTLHEAYADKGLVIIGFPANNFMGQEPGNEAEMAEFCERNYGVSFLMASKISVLGEDQYRYSICMVYE